MRRSIRSEERIAEMLEKYMGIDAETTLRKLEQTYEEYPDRYKIIMNLFKNTSKS